MAKKAVIQIGGHQYIVAEGDQIETDLVQTTDKKTMSFEAVMTMDGKDVGIGKGKVEAKVVEENVKGDKVTSIRYKSKKRVHKVRGHRQQHAVLEVTKIS